MRLKRLELAGFKSFADRTSLVFDSSLVGIVGPNGCGKSNVVDAIRWVLGETRPTSMRGGEMTDVIFKGSVSRPAMGVAEVTLVLDNAAGELGDRGAEVSITRRVDRSGEGEYLINGAKVRLKDLRDMLYDTGLGSRGYSVLEQGRIDAVLSQNPLDRRAIFEEAAGVSRYRQRKKETEARLKRVELDVTRLDDILRELQTRVRSLKVQAGKAERYVAARDEWKIARTRFLKHRVHQASGELAALRAALLELETKAEALRAQRQGEESDAQAREREQRALSAEVDRASDDVARLFGESRALDERAAQLSERVGAWRAQAEEESSRALQLARQLELREAELEALTQDRARRAEVVAAAQARFDALRTGLESVRAEFRTVRDESERHNQTVLRLLHQKTAASNTLAHLEDSRAPLGERSERAKLRVDEAQHALDEMQGTASGARERQQSLERELVGLEAERAALAARITEHDRSALELSGEKTRVEVERARLSSRIDALLDWEREREALEAGARALYSGIERGEGPCSGDALRGVLADHLRTSTRFARALDAALGDRALALVASDRDTAARLVRWLSERRAGAVRLVVPGALARRDRRGAPAFDEAQSALLQNRLLDTVEVSSELRVLAEVLVGDVWVARDLASALQLVEAHPDLRFVTLEGDLVDAGGLFGGHREIAQGAIGRRSTAHELEHAREELVRRLEDLSTRIALAVEQRRELESERVHAESRAGALRDALAQAKSDNHAAKVRVADLEESLASQRHELEVLSAEVARLERDLDDARARVASVDEEYAKANLRLAELETRRGELEARRDELQLEHGECEVETARAKAELDSIAARERDLARGLADSQRELERSRRLSGEHADNAKAGAAEAERLARASQELETARAKRDGELADLRRTERAGREAIEAYRRRADAATRELEELSSRISAQKLEEQRVDLERADLVVRAREELSLDEIALSEGFTPEPELALHAALAELEARVGELKSTLDKLGPVNTESVAELAEAEQRFEFLDGQRKDLARSRQSLEETLAEINTESERLFLETFEDVRVHFQVLFRQLFGGGKADLVMMPGEGPLEAGIEITARPPGREMLPIGLLSGGQRTMTALALLFAVFKARPSPFCVLDEVDAALDDANVGRFLAMVDGFRTHTQFIVVTHNKGTMAACSALYGITMEVKGVSRHVSVQFGDVDAIDPQATGNARVASQTREETSRQAAALEPELSEHSVHDGSRELREQEHREPREPELLDAEPVIELQPVRKKRREAAPKAASTAPEVQSDPEPEIRSDVARSDIARSDTARSDIGSEVQPAQAPASP